MGYSDIYQRERIEKYILKHEHLEGLKGDPLTGDTWRFIPGKGACTFC